MAVEESLHTQMNNLIDSAQWERAKNVVYELLAHQPESSWLHCNMGLVLHNLQDYKNAEIHLKTAIAHDPGYADAYNHLSYVYIGMGRIGTADDCNKTALSLAPNDPDNIVAALNLALAYDNIPLAEHHLKCLEREIPDSALLTSQRNALLSHPKNKNKLDAYKQIEAQKKTLSQDPEYSSAHEEIATLHLKHTKNYSEAEKHIKQALTLEPDDKDYHRVYAKIIRKKNLLIRFLSWPLALFEKHDNEDKQALLIIITMLGVAFLGTSLPPTLLPYLKFAVLALICSFIFLYPIVKLYEYLTLTELYHEMNKVHLFKGPFSKIHRLSYVARFTIFAIITFIFWAIITLTIIQYFPL